MLASTSSANRRASQPKHKAACDHCTVSKVKCPGGGPPCKRCADSSQPCHYSLARRFGKPPGSKNRRTLERLRQAKDGDLKSSTRTGGGCSIPQNNDSRDDGDGNGAIDGQSERWEGDDFLGQPQTSDRTSSWSTSPLTNYHTSSDILQFIPSPEQGFWNGYDNMPPDRGDRSVFHFAEPDSPKIGGLEQAESRRTWADHPDDCWNSSSPSTDQQLSSDPTDTGRLLCQCLREYANVLCKLQVVENRQRPVQADDFLTYTNLVLNTAEKQSKCSQCLYDCCVAMQLIMIIQMIFTWSQDQYQFRNAPGPELRVTLGQHETTEEERSFVKLTLISKAVYRIIALLKDMMSRFDSISLNGQGKSPWDLERVEFWNLQQLVGSLIQSYGDLSKRLIEG